MQQKQPTPAMQWRQARQVGVPVDFPISGHTAYIRPVDVDFFLGQDEGSIPNAMLQPVLDLMNLKQTQLPPVEELEKDLKWKVFLDRLCMHAFVSPVCKGSGEKLDEGDISVDDIPYRDKVFLYRLFTYPARVLTKFREVQQGRVLAGVGTEQTSGQTSQSGDGDKGVGQPPDGDAGLVDGLAV